MYADESCKNPAQFALSQSMAAAGVVALIDESLLILSQKRRTLEEKAIVTYFCSLACAYAGIIGCLHMSVSRDELVGQVVVDLLPRLQTVNENVRSCVEELLKVLKYDFNYLEQYFEYDYCARLLGNQELLAALAEIQSGLQALV
jgi:hypothetical protein